MSIELSYFQGDVTNKARALFALDPTARQELTRAGHGEAVERYEVRKEHEVQALLTAAREAALRVFDEQDRLTALLHDVREARLNNAMPYPTAGAVR